MKIAIMRKLFILNDIEVTWAQTPNIDDYGYSVEVEISQIGKGILPNPESENNNYLDGNYENDVDIDDYDENFIMIKNKPIFDLNCTSSPGFADEQNSTAQTVIDSFQVNDYENTDENALWVHVEYINEKRINIDHSCALKLIILIMEIL